MNRLFLFFSMLLLPWSIAAWEAVDDQEPLQKLLVEHSDLVDPFTAQFRSLKYKSIEDTGAQMWCGEINAKNRLGAYTGWAAIYVLKSSDGEVKTQIVDEDAIYSAILVNGLCQNDDS